MPFVKLDTGILDSSIWSEDVFVRILWFTFLTKANRDGFVACSRSGLLRAANIPEDMFLSALTRLEGPDLESRSPENDGVRVVKVDGGWNILNYKKYRDKDYADNRREQFRIASKKYREKTNRQQNDDVELTGDDRYVYASAYASESVSESLSVEVPVLVNKPNKEKKEDVETEIIPELIIPDHIKESWGDLMEIRKKKKAVQSPKALRMLLVRLLSLSSNPSEQVEILQNSIIGSWTNVFPLKKDKPYQTISQPSLSSKDALERVYGKIGG